MLKPARSQFYWQHLSLSRPSGISYRLSNGKCGSITNPLALRLFYTKLSARNGRKNQSP
jgi:hypothetical protein